MMRGGVTNSYLFDGLGSVTELTDPQGRLTERVRYDAYGAPTITAPDGTVRSQSAYANPVLFTGRWLDGETNLYDYRARMYDPRLGRFLQRDPLTWGPEDLRLRVPFNKDDLWQAGVLVEGQVDPRLFDPNAVIHDALRRSIATIAGQSPSLFHRYSYVGNNPARWVDPFGLTPREFRTYTWPYSWKGWVSVILMGTGGATLFVPLPGARLLGWGLMTSGAGFGLWDIKQGVDEAFQTGRDIGETINDAYQDEWEEIDRYFEN